MTTECIAICTAACFRLLMNIFALTPNRKSVFRCIDGSLSYFTFNSKTLKREIAQTFKCEHWHVSERERVLFLLARTSYQATTSKNALVNVRARSSAGQLWAVLYTAGCPLTFSVT